MNQVSAFMHSFAGLIAAFPMVAAVLIVVFVAVKIIRRGI